MKKSNLVLVLMMVLAITLCGCTQKIEKIFNEEPDILQVQNICNLATLDCYYHNVAKSVKYKESGITHIGEKNRDFWIEYTGIARLGIDMSKVSMSINGNDIELTMPEAEVLKITIDKTTLDESSYIISKDGINSNKITANDQTEAINNAQKEMEETVKKNSSLLLNAQNRAKVLIENYINQLGEATGVEYNIKWVFSNDSSNSEVSSPDVPDVTEAE